MVLLFARHLCVDFYCSIIRLTCSRCYYCLQWPLDTNIVIFIANLSKGQLMPLPLHHLLLRWNPVSFFWYWLTQVILYKAIKSVSLSKGQI